MIETRKSKAQKNFEYREKVKLDKCKQIIDLAKQITKEGGGDVRFVKEDKT